MRVSEILNERFMNLIGPVDQPTRDKYRDQVWDILQRSYAGIGGIKGSGFKDPQDMDNIPMWKLIMLNDELHGVIMYKDKQGRKSVAIGSNGSQYAKDKIEDIYRNDLTRAYSEKSKSALGFIMKKTPWDTLKQYMISPDIVRHIMGEDVIPINSLAPEDWPLDAQVSIRNYPQLLDYGYLRELGGELTFKVMTGTPHNSIIS